MLKDIHVLDLADETGSFCSKLLADLGASVVKVEGPEGDRSREIGPFQAIKPGSESSLFFAYHNTNKLGITLNLREKADRQTFLTLITNTDVFVESFHSGYLETIGLGFETLRKTNPGLIHIAISGFGKKGFGAHRRSCDIVASASGGQMFIMGDPSGRPLVPFGEQSYYIVSLFGAVRIILALRERARSGKGVYVDLSLQEAVASTLDNVMTRWFYEKTITQRQGCLYGNSAFSILPCKDGYVQLTLLQQWETFVELMAADGMARDLSNIQWQDEAYRTGHIPHIIEVAGEWTKKHTTEELFSLGQAMRFPWAPLCSLTEVLKSPQLQARDFFMLLDDPARKMRVPCPGVPFKFSSVPKAPIRPAPLLGEHNKTLSGGLLWPQPTITGKAFSARDNSRPVITDRGILTGVRVLDFTWMLAGPYATRILADCGAEVIKVQSAKTARGAEMNASGYFNTWNRNKRSVTLDLSKPEARDIVLNLTAVSDIVVENFSPRVMSNWELSYSVLKKIKPDLIMASISAMGQTGPWKDYTGYGPTFHALSGLSAMTSNGQESPVGLGHAYADTIIGLYSALAILAALKHRDTAGEGQHIDISGYEAICTLLGPAFLHAGLGEAIISSGGYYGDNIPAAPYGCYRCAGEDRWCVIAIFNEDEWLTFCRLLGNPGWTSEGIFSTLIRRRKNRAALDHNIETWTCLHTPETVVDLLQNHGIATGIVANAEDLAKDPSLTSRNFFIELVHPILGRTTSDRSAITFPKETINRWKSAPLLGEDNRYVFRELLGFTEEKFLSLITQGVIG